MLSFKIDLKIPNVIILIDKMDWRNYVPVVTVNPLEALADLTSK